MTTENSVQSAETGRRRKRMANRVYWEALVAIPVLHALRHLTLKLDTHPDLLVAALLRQGLQLPEVELRRLVENEAHVAPLGEDSLGPMLSIPDLPPDRQEPPFPKSRFIAKVQDRFGSDNGSSKEIM